MTHRFPIKEIARQAGLGTATVDRVLNARAHVSAQTRLRVAAAIEELSAQEAQLAARGRRLFLDVVVEAPKRFSREVKAATEAILPDIDAAVCRPRFLMQDIMEDAEVVSALARIMKRGSQGICLKVRDTPRIRAAVAKLTAARIPVVTLATDLVGTDRLAYVGLDNVSAGRTAAFLIAMSIGHASGSVLTTRSHARFLGEEARETAFVDALTAQCPNLRVIGIQGGSGVNYNTARVLAESARSLHDLCAVYSMGGGNQSILSALDHEGVKPKLFIAHDLDRENRQLLTNRRVDVVLHHDLQEDMRRAFRTILHHHGLAGDRPKVMMSTVQIITSENIPDSPRALL